MALSTDLQSAGSIRQRQEDKIGIQATIISAIPSGVETIDLNGERFQYGLIDSSGNAVEPIYAHGLKELEGSEGLHALTFVAAQFSSMKRRYEELSSKQGSMYGFLNPVRAATRLDLGYKQYINNLIGSFTYELYKQKKNQVYSFDDFCKQFIKFIINTRVTSTSGGMPVTKTSYIISNKTSVNDSGLAIEFKDSGFNNSEETIFPWIADKNFPLYCDAAKKAGFMVDINYPFRLVADLSSKKMQAAAEFYGSKNYLPGTSGDIFETFYTQVSLTDYIILKNKLFKGYDIFTQGNTRDVTHVVPCYNKAKKILTKREPLLRSYRVIPPIPGRPDQSLEELFGPDATVESISADLHYGQHSEKYNILYFLDLYAKIRYHEIYYTSKYLTLTALDAIVSTAKRMVLRGSPNDGFRYINEKLKSYRMLIH